MLRLLRRFLDAVGALAFLLGILYVPADIEGLPEALKPIGKVLNMFERETYLVALCVALILYIAWIDVRPYVRRWLGWDSRKELLGKVEQSIADGVKQRNLLNTNVNIKIDEQWDKFRQWNAGTMDTLGKLSVPERSYFRTLDLFTPITPNRSKPDPPRDHLSSILSEKIKRLREIMTRLDS